MQRDRWRISLLAREAVLNLFGKGSRSYALLILAIVLGTGQTLFFALEGVAFTDQVNDLNAKGRNVAILAAADPDTPVAISRASCEALESQVGVSRAGLLIDNGRADVIAVGESIATYRASATLFPGLKRADALIGSALGAEPGHVVIDDEIGRAELASTEPDGLNANTSIVIGLTSEDGSGPICALVFERYVDTKLASQLAAAAVSTQGGQIAANVVLSLPSDPIAAFLERPTRYLPLLLGLLGAIATGIAFQLRASELAAYRLSGSSPSSMTLMASLECATIGGLAGASAALSAILLNGILLDLATLGLRALILAGVWTVAAGLFALRLTTRGPVDLAKDR